MAKKSIVILGMRNSGKTVFVSVMANYLQQLCNNSTDSLSFKQDVGHTYTYIKGNYDMLTQGKWPNRTTTYEKELSFNYDEDSSPDKADKTGEKAAAGAAAVTGVGLTARVLLAGGATLATGGVALLGVAAVGAGAYFAGKYLSKKAKKAKTELAFHDFPGEDFEKMGQTTSGDAVLSAVKKATGILLVVDSEAMVNGVDHGEDLCYARLFKAVEKHNSGARVAIVFNKLELFYKEPDVETLSNYFKSYKSAHAHLKGLKSKCVEYFLVYGLGSREKLVLTEQGDREFVPSKGFKLESRGIDSVIGWLIESEQLKGSEC